MDFFRLEEFILFPRKGGNLSLWLGEILRLSPNLIPIAVFWPTSLIFLAFVMYILNPLLFNQEPDNDFPL